MPFTVEHRRARSSRDRAWSMTTRRA